MKTTARPKPVVTETLSSQFSSFDLVDPVGKFHDGYTPEQASRVLEALHAVTGIQLGVLWEYHDDDGFGGGSEFVVVRGDAVFAIEEGTERLSAMLFRSARPPHSLRLKLGKQLRPIVMIGEFNYATEARNRETV